MKQPKGYIAYQNCEGSSSIRFTNYKSTNIDETESLLEADHTWHTNHSQLNIIVDLIYNFVITWGKRQEEVDLKLESLRKEYQ